MSTTACSIFCLRALEFREESRRQLVCEKFAAGLTWKATGVSHSGDELSESIAIFFAHKIRGELILSDGGGQVLQRMLPYSLLDILDWHGRDDRHAAYQIVEGDIRCAAELQKLDRVLGLSRPSLNRICIQHIADMWPRDERHN